MFPLERLRWPMDQVTLQGAGCTDIGLNRLLNEDFYEIKENIYILADGMGGHNAGDIASRLAVEHFIDLMDHRLSSESNDLQDELYLKQIIQENISKTNEIIFEKSVDHIEYKGMGTTLVLALFQTPNTIHIANVGDSRAYLFRDNSLDLLTEDHTVTAAMLRDKTITASEVETHPYRHHLTRSMGTSKTINAFSSFFQIVPNDRILLCSDGLWNVLSEKEIIDSFQKHSHSERICNDLIKKAKEKQSKDNISCIVIKVSKIKK